MSTGFFWDERCFWHFGGAYALTLPVGGLVQPLAAGGLPESPETKRRFKNIMDVTGLSGELHLSSATPATREELLRVHPAAYLDRFAALSDAGGGELGPRAPFGPGGYEIACLSAGMARDALFAVADGRLGNAYSLSRPPGHHCLPEKPNGFCLLANIAVAVEAALVAGKAGRIAVLDWDVHHGNGTEAIFRDRADVLTVSLHQERNYPLDTGAPEDRGEGGGYGANLNLPLPPGTGQYGYLAAMERIVLPAIRAFEPDAIVVACGFDACAFDPLAQMLLSAGSFRLMTRQVMELAADLCGGRLVLVHEGGYSEAYVPFCGHAVMEELSASTITAPDPMAATVGARQPGPRFDRFLDDWIADLATGFGLSA